ncbi:hypothetical protein VTJ83DRAFT_3820 [Remersonia thermophila]|uniref:Lytic polysaccharide monooxygenase n=1 Tax=Remersonia thermophila TaxID=72144 RepID=A0ABR4DF89_9PEZI
MKISKPPHPLTLAALLGIAALTDAHMMLVYPQALRSKLNPHTTPDMIDYSLTSPLSNDGSDFPCKGSLSLLGTLNGASVARWTVGGEYNFTLAGGATHNGGSCQVAVSVDDGARFYVLHSYEGGCPIVSSAPGTGSGAGTGVGSSFRFRLPRDTPPRKGAVFAWTWFNNLGNREMYMNCAVVDVVGGHGGSEKVPFESRPALFMANIGNGCRTVEGKDVKFPDPGPDVDVNSRAGLMTPLGNCGGGGESSRRGTGSGTQDVGSSENQGWTRGNYWPHGFMSAAVKRHGPLYLVVLLCMVLFAFFLS